MADITTTAGPPVTYQFTVEELRSRLSVAIPTTIETAADRKAVREAIAVRRSLRGDIEAKRKELKAGALEYGRRVDSVARQLVAVVEETELPLKALKDADDERRAAEKRAKEEEERQAREAEIRRQREAEEKRLAEERAQLEAERKRLEAQRQAAEEAARKERERVEAEQRAEREKLEEERRRLEEAQRAEAERQRVEREKAEAEARAERERLEVERRELAEAKARAEREEAERQARIRAEQEAKERAERERIEAEEAALREKERQAEHARRLEALRPDNEKLRAWSEELLAIRGPELRDEAAREVVADALSWIGRAREEIHDWLHRCGDETAAAE